MLNECSPYLVSDEARFIFLIVALQCTVAQSSTFQSLVVVLLLRTTSSSSTAAKISIYQNSSSTKNLREISTTIVYMHTWTTLAALLVLLVVHTVLPVHNVREQPQSPWVTPRCYHDVVLLVEPLWHPTPLERSMCTQPTSGLTASEIKAA